MTTANVVFSCAVGFLVLAAMKRSLGYWTLGVCLMIISFGVMS